MSTKTAAAARERFEMLWAEHRVDLDSGAWDRTTNARVAVCPRCSILIPAGEGRPFNIFMSDGYRASTAYLCRLCAEEVVAS